MPQVQARHAQQPLGGGQQAAQHPERRGLARAVGAQQPEHFAAFDLKSYAFDRVKVTEAPFHPLDFNNGTIAVARSCGTGRLARSGRRAGFGPSLAKQAHKTVFEPGRRRLD